MTPQDTSTFVATNSELGLWGDDGKFQLDKDKQSANEYFKQHVNPNTRFYNNTAEKYRYLIENNYYRSDIIDQYDLDDVIALNDYAFSKNHRFDSFLGARKFYNQYALTDTNVPTEDGSVTYIERFEDRVVAVALDLARGDIDLAYKMVDEIISGRYQPATPTFLNAAKVAAGERVSCFLLRVEDNMESIGRAVNSALQLSKRGGGVALSLTNLREQGAAIKGIPNASSGVIPVMKILEDSFSYANQLGARQGAGAVYLNAHHPDILRFLDTKRENADEKIRIKTLSMGVVIPDITFELAKKNEKMWLFSPVDVERVYGKAFSDISVTEHYYDMVSDDRIRKYPASARELFTTISEIQFESGYPYIMFEDTVNRTNPIWGRINMSNLCSEILQINTASEYHDDLTYKHVGQDISCNLGSLNIAKTMESPDFADTVETAIRALTAVSETTSIDSVPSIRRANDEGHSIGLGQMNLHGFFGRERIFYDSPEAVEFTSVYFAMIAYHALRASHKIAVERGTRFAGFEDSDYASGVYFDKYVNQQWEPTLPDVVDVFDKYGVKVPSQEDWRILRDDIMRDGIFHRYLQAVPPTGSISYINGSTSSIHPIAAKIEIRKEGKVGRVYYPAAYMTNDNLEYYRDAYELGPEAILNVYAAATEHVDQGLSCTLFFPDTATTRDLNKAYISAWRKGIKTLYYVRIRQAVLEGTEAEGCVSCQL